MLANMFYLLMQFARETSEKKNETFFPLFYTNSSKDFFSVNFREKKLFVIAEYDFSKFKSCLCINWFPKRNGQSVSDNLVFYFNANHEIGSRKQWIVD